MQFQTLLIKNILLIDICIHVQAIPILQKHDFIIEHSNNTNKFSLEINLSMCISDSDCYKNSWCHENKCECKKGWSTWYDKKHCLYKQRSKSSTFIISFIFGGTGIDWFILSRKNNLYILTGLLKFLTLIASCIWSRIAIINKTKTSIIVPSCFSISLSFIIVIWWFIDWMRILLNKFPDGNGAPLI